VASGYLFVARAESGTITDRYAIGKQAGIPLRAPTHGSPFALTPAGASVWASSFASGALTLSSTAAALTSGGQGIEALLRIRGRAPSLAVRGSPPDPRAAVAAGMGGLEIGDRRSGASTPASPGSCESIPDELCREADPGRAYADFAVGDGSIWLTNPANSVDRMDAKTYGVSKTIHVGKNPLESP
jgi:hypothetical protein